MVPAAMSRGIESGSIMSCRASYSGRSDRSKVRWPAGNRLLQALIAFFVLLGIASFWLPLRISTPLASRAVLIGVVGIAGCGAEATPG